MNVTEEYQEESCIHSNLSCLRTSPAAVDTLLYMCVGVVVLLTVLGNLLVIISICHFKQLQTPTNFLLLSLAMADFLVGAILMPLYFTMLTEPLMCFSAGYCIIFNIAAFYLTVVSIYNVALIAVDRYFSISNPFHYSMKMTLNVSLRIISILWLSSLIYCMVLLHFYGDVLNIKVNITCVECSVPFNEMLSIIDFVFVFIVPCLTIIIMYLKIFFIAKNHANTIQCVQKFVKSNDVSATSEKKAAKGIGILVSVFLLCLVPFYICAFLAAYINNKALHIAGSNMATLVFLNSAINPIIYALFYPWFQRCVKHILTYKIFRSGSSYFNVLAH